MKTVVTAPISHLCPYVDEVDHGTVTLAFDGPAPELHDLRAAIDSWHSTKTTHEDLTDWLAARYPDAQVETRWSTAGLDVVVTA